MGPVQHRSRPAHRALRLHEVSRLADEPQAQAHTWRNARAWVVIATVIIAFTAADLVTKSLAFARVAPQPVEIQREQVLATPINQLQSLLPAHAPVVVVEHVLELKLVLNAGAVFGAAQGRRIFFITFTFLALGFALALFAFWTPRADYLSHTALGMVVAGGLGNLYDRVRFACVRDFLHPLPTAQLPFGITWPSGDPAVWPYISNVADAVLLLGIGLLMIQIWRNAPAPEAAQDDASASDETPTTEPASETNE